MKTIAIAGTFDSKGEEFLFIKKIIESYGIKTLTIHMGVFEPKFIPDINNDVIAREIGQDINEISSRKDRGLATEILCKGLIKLLPKLYKEGKFDGIISCGGSGGTSLIAPAMRELPVGVPKIIVSTVASTDNSGHIGTSDIIMIPSIVDVSGLNSISKKIFTNATNAICGMVKNETLEETQDKPLIAATMFGVTTPCVDTARKYLEEKGYEVLVFHATGTGGKTMESLIDSGFFKGVLDITTTEWCDELFGGILNGGPNRLEAAGKNNIPQVVSVGALDMVNFGPIDSVPQKYKNRNLYKHNPSITLMRTNVEENRELGKIIAKKLNISNSPTALMLPLKGVSMIDNIDQVFYGKDENETLFTTLKENITNENVEIIEMDNHINDYDFALAAARKLEELMSKIKAKA